MKFKGTLISEASGSLAGLTFSHNTYGQYIRGRIVPTNPNSDPQVIVRTQMANAHVAWLALPQATKDAWNAYAAGTPISNTLGATIYLTGRVMFLRDYVLRKRFAVDLPATVVETMGLTDVKLCTLAVTAPNVGSLTFDQTDTWATAATGRLFIYCSQGKGVGTNFYRGPYLAAATVEGGVAPPATPKVFTTPYNVQAGQKVFGRVIASDAEGRLSEAQFLVCTSS